MMQSKFPKKLVNWQGSMQLSAGTFIQTEDFFIESIRGCAAVNLTRYNYGLLPVKGYNDSADNIQIRSNATSSIDIRVTQCNAITSSGIRIDFNPTDENGALTKRFSPEQEGRQDVDVWDVIIAVNPFNRIPTGELDPNETPPRHPDVEYAHSLHVVPTGEINTTQFGGHYLNIGRIRKEADRFVVDTYYIPPCSTMSSHTDLMSYHTQFATILTSIENSSKNIITKVNMGPENSELPANISSVCRDVMRYIASVYFAYRNKGLDLAPIETLEWVAGLAHAIHVNLCFMKGPHKEELLRYFYEWCDTSPGTFEQKLSDMLEMSYKHDKIRRSMLEAEAFLKMFAGLWEKMSSLEYIGQRKESMIISEKKLNTENERKDEWMLID